MQTDIRTRQVDGVGRLIVWIEVKTRANILDEVLVLEFDVIHSPLSYAFRLLFHLKSVQRPTCCSGMHCVMGP